MTRTSPIGTPRGPTASVDENRAWEAVLERSTSDADAFVYAVRTTGVYCRANCASRRPRRQNVTFYRTAQDAAAAGFRPCKRCRPDGTDPLGELLNRACAYLEDHLDEMVTLARLGEEVGMSPSHLQRSFKRRVGVSPREYADALRVTRLKAHLRKGGKVTRAIYDSGYGSASTAYAIGNIHLGMTPATYRAGGRGATIAFSTVECPLGRLLVARTDRGVCAVSLGDTDRELEAALRDEFPFATLERDPQRLRHECGLVAELASGGREGGDIPLDVRATEFQWRVWRALREIPRGETRSYTEVARSIGEPRGARAVARACASNPIALVVPCHRVVRADGSPAGYRWGVSRKLALIDSEADARAGAQREPARIA
jgi:AraC family transcriptional regulator of adaptative response/methylated-DNA-[protein]-cysteine methyltransferase